MSADESRPGDRARDRRFPRWPLAAAAALVAVALAGAVTLRAMFPPEKLRALVVPRIEAAAGRDVELSSVRLKIFPRIAVRLDDLAIANPPGFSSEPMLSLDALDLQVRLTALLRREIELREVRLVRPLIRYEVDADGVSNFAGLGAPQRTGADRPALAGVAVAGLVVSGLTLQGGSVVYSDRRTGRGARFGLEAELRTERAPGAADAVRGDGWIEVRSIRLTRRGRGVDGIAFPDGRLEFRGLLADTRGEYLEAEDLGIGLGGVRLAGSMSVRRAGGVRTLDLAVESDELDMADLLAALPVADRFADIGAAGRARLSLRAGGPVERGGKLWFTAEMTLEDLSLAYGGYGRAVTGASGSLRLSADSLLLPSLEGRLFGRPFRLGLTVFGFEDPIVDGRASASLDLARLSDLRERVPAVEGDVDLDLRFRGPAKRPEALEVTGPVTLTGVRYRSEALAVPAVIRRATLRLTGAGVSAEAIPIELGTSDLTLSFSAPGALRFALSGGRAAAPVVEFAVTSQRLDLSEVRAETGEESAGYSELVTARLAGRKLDGRDPADIARDRYSLPTLPAAEAVGRVRIAYLLDPPTEARDVSFDVVLKDGVLQVRDVAGKLYGGSLTGSLSLDLRRAGDGLPLSYDLRLKRARAEEFLARWTRLGAAVSGAVDFQIGGATALDDALLPSIDMTHATGRAVFRDGAFGDFGISDALVRRLGLDASATSRFERLGGGFEIRNGAFLLDSWDFTSGGITGAITGRAGLGGMLDLDLALKVPPSMLERAGWAQGAGGLDGLLGALAGDDEAIDLAVGVGGTISNPILELDAEALRKTLERRLGDAGQDLLRRFLKPRKKN